MRVAALLTIGCVMPLAAPCETAAVAKKTHHAKKSTKTAATRSKTAKTAGTHAKATGKRSKRKSAASWRSRQLAPTADRYKEIQSALVKRGYLNGAPNGVWDASSAEALKHFQQDQNLEPSGKLNSLSLIALGLGAKRGAPIAGAASAPPSVLSPHPPVIDSPPAIPQNAIPPSQGPSLAVPEIPPPAPTSSLGR